MGGITMQESKKGEPFYELVGKQVTFNCELIGHSGNVLHTKGEKATVQKVFFIPGHYFRGTTGMWIEPELRLVKLTGIYGHFKADTFEELIPKLFKKDNYG